ncbi:MAG: cation transporter [Bacteroidota bacterium]
MTHSYQITGMTCSGCEAKVKGSLLALPDVTTIELSKESNSATITMEKHISLKELQQAIGGTDSKYRISASHHSEVAEQTKSWLLTYKPLLLIFTFITGISILTSFKNGQFLEMQFMNHFMAGFFITFSFFKLLDLKGFAESYSMYDIVAKKPNLMALSILLWNWDWAYFFSFSLPLLSQTQQALL